MDIIIFLGEKNLPWTQIPSLETIYDYVIFPLRYLSL